MSRFGEEVLYRTKGKEFRALVIEDRGGDLVDLMVYESDKPHCVRSVPFWMRLEPVERRGQDGEMAEVMELVERSDGAPCWRPNG